MILLQESDISYVVSQQNYSRVAEPPVFEWEHGGPHLFVGGHMDNVTCSPSDPTFYLHHSFVDFIWEEFRQQRQSRQQRESDYPRNVNVTALHHPNTIMSPFDPLENIHGMQNIYVDSYFRFAPRLISCSTSSDCTGYLFCHQGRCKSKIRLTGNCRGLPEGSREPCECGVCVRDRCTLTDPSQQNDCFQ